MKDYQENELKKIVQQLDIMVETVQRDNSLQRPDLRRIIRFINKVILVVDQAFQDVLSTFEDLRYLNDEDISSGVLPELIKDVELLRNRDKYRNVEYICGRLSTLKDIYHQQIAPLVSQYAYNTQAWQDVFWLIEDREGKIIMMVDNLVWEIRDCIDTFQSGKISLQELKHTANENYKKLRASIEELHKLNNKIMGFSGEAGILELTDTGDDIKKQTIVMKAKNNPWISGSFYLIAAVIVLSLLLVAAKMISPIALPIIIVGGLIIFSVIGAYQLRNDDKLSDKSFLELMGLSFKQIPFIRSNKK